MTPPSPVTPPGTGATPGVLHVDSARGSDGNSGTATAPFRSVGAARGENGGGGGGSGLFPLPSCGGRGGHGSGGSGGPSVGIVVLQRSTLTQVGNTFTLGSGGTGGASTVAVGTSGLRVDVSMR